MAKTIKEEKVISFETFRKIGSYEAMNLKQDEPSCFNGMVRLKKYKVTIEEIDEPIEVYKQRLQKMWEACDNHHHYEPLKNAANSIGLILSSGDLGKAKHLKQQS